MIQLPEYHQTKEQIAERIAQYAALPLKNFNEKEAYRFALGCIDLTTLEGSDNSAKIQQLCEKAKSLRTAAVCVYPPFIKQAKELLENTSINVASVAGAFPSGQSPLFVKLAEVAYAVEEGADEIDMVLAIGKAKSGDWEGVAEDIRQVVTASMGHPVKVILETGLLSDEEKRKACSAAVEAGAKYVKTSTGFGHGGATVEDIRLMRESVGDKCRIKASGGIRDYATAKAMVEAGADRLGTSSGVAIVKDEAND